MFIFKFMHINKYGNVLYPPTLILQEMSYAGEYCQQYSQQYSLAFQSVFLYFDN